MQMADAGVEVGFSSATAAEQRPPSAAASIANLTTPILWIVVLRRPRGSAAIAGERGPPGRPRSSQAPTPDIQIGNG